jgi:amino acid transporter
MLRYFIIMLTVLAALLGGVWFGASQAWWSLPAMWIQVLVFLFVAMLIIGVNLLRIRKNQPQVFVQFYLLSIALKMLAGLAFIFFLIWDNPAEAAPLAALFMVGYILFTGTEVVFLLPKNPDR